MGCHRKPVQHPSTTRSETRKRCVEFTTQQTRRWLQWGDSMAALVAAPWCGAARLLDNLGEPVRSRQARPRSRCSVRPPWLGAVARTQPRPALAVRVRSRHHPPACRPAPRPTPACSRPLPVSDQPTPPPTASQAIRRLRPRWRAIRPPRLPPRPGPDTSWKWAPCYDGRDCF